MPWCPKCRAEYVEGVRTCSDCNYELVDVLPPRLKPVYDDPVLLVTVYNRIEADSIESMLMAHGIKTQERISISAIFGLGNSVVDIFVSSKNLAKAQQLLKTK